MPKHVSLTGMMGSGKSSVGPNLARLLGRPFIDVDAQIVAREGRLIAEIFTQEGEGRFREIEQEVIAGLMAEPPAVMALGGGAFLWQATRDLLLEKTVVIYLQAQVETLCERLKAEIAHRPLLAHSGTDLRQTVSELLERRGPGYAQAHHTVKTDGVTPELVATEIASLRAAYE